MKKASLVASLLLGKAPNASKGKVVSFYDSEPTLELLTGSTEDRVMACLTHIEGPQTFHEITDAIEGGKSRVVAALKSLEKKGLVSHLYDAEGVKRYCLNPDSRL